MKTAVLVIGFAISLSAFAAEKPSICQTINTAVASGSDSQKLKKFLDAQWKYLMTQYPEWATYVGYPGQNHRWMDRSLMAIEGREKETVCLQNALSKISRGGLRGEERINYDLQKRNLAQEIEGFRFGQEYLVVDQLGGPHMEIADMLRNMPQMSVKDYENMLTRMDAFPTVLEQSEILLREGLKRKITAVKMFLGRVPSQFDRVLVAKPEDSPIYEAFKEIKADLPADKKANIQKRALAIIQQKIYPALQKFKTFLVKEYIPGAREGIALSDMPDGKAWYAYMVKKHTTINRTPDQLHDLGLSEVARITKEMNTIREKVKFKGDLKAFNNFLLKDKQFYYTNKEDLMMGFRNIAKMIDPELPKLFKTLPRTTYGIREMPEYKAKESPAAYYEGGSLEAGRAGYFTANTYDLKARPKWGMEALTAHEAVPGHHFQIAIAQEVKELPEIRRYGGDYTAFTEGWGLYAESLGSEIGLYKDPYSKYGQLSYEMWRAIRLVVDTGIHSKGWTRERAIDYFMNNMPKAQLEAEVEVDRYITWPGQALAYKVGELKFKELRAHAKAELGDKFDVRSFHDELLKHAPLPMDVLEKSVNEWIHSVKTAKNKSDPTQT